MTKYRLSLLAGFLFVTGLCALIYETIWLREMRFIFGGSTAATSAVTSVFLGGIGFGALFWGRLADRSSDPLKLYALFEIAVAVSTSLSPLLIKFSTMVYGALGGTVALNPLTAAFIRFCITLAVMGLPAFVMGGTLPAAARYVEHEQDRGRRDLALLYGANTLGAVSGVLAATFYMLEHFGSSATMLLACSLNLAVGASAYLASRRRPYLVPVDPESTLRKAVVVTGAARAMLILTGAAITGFVFILMELVWYRMLAPILGGSTYTLGLILAVALAGIGMGSTLYSFRGHAKRPTFFLFSISCCLEALFLITPFALGDRLALLSAYLQPLGNFGLPGHVLGWFLISVIVILPAALVAGYQFPLLIGLFGQGRSRVGRQVGLIYATNTIGTILGSLAGGLILMPLLNALVCWQIAGVLLLGLGAAAMIMAFGREAVRLPLILPVAIGLFALLLTTSAQGPTAVWRHSPIGAGRADLVSLDLNGLHDWKNRRKRGLVWKAEGLESSIALKGTNGLTLLVNGKSDGNAKLDAGTQIMAPMVAAILHPAPEKAMVIGLGTGSSGGWLASIETMRQVDIVELEPTVVEVARRCSPVNRNVLDNPKVQMLYGDGREVMLATREKYDLIFSEPSNPYRAGVASLYTREFYENVADRLEDDGYFSQWVQGYEINRETYLTIYATLASVFKSVTVWQTLQHDILFVCSKQMHTYSWAELRQRVEMEPFRSALLNGWNITGLEGFLAAFLANDSVARKILRRMEQEDRINTDDRMLVEFGFARSVGISTNLINDFRQGVRMMDGHRLPGNEPIDLEAVDNNYFLLFPWGKEYQEDFAALPTEQKQELSLLYYYQVRDYRSLMNLLQSYFREPTQPLELAAFGEAMAQYGRKEALPVSQQLRKYWPAAADAILSRYYLITNDNEHAYTHLLEAVKGFRHSPWTHEEIIRHTLDLATHIARNGTEYAKGLIQELAEPFAVRIANDYRILKLFELGLMVDSNHALVGLEQMEPYVFWEEEVLKSRKDTYQATAHPLLSRAQKDLEEFRHQKGTSLRTLLAR